MVVEVAYTGIGLGEDDTERIFERSYRVPRTGARLNASGTGIGLTIARGIVQAHGGTLVATSGGGRQGIDVHHAAADRDLLIVGTASGPEGRTMLPIEHSVGSGTLSGERADPAWCAEGHSDAP